MPEEEITSNECAELRRAARRDFDLADLADGFRISLETAERHAHGRCSHAVEEPAIDPG